MKLSKMTKIIATLGPATASKKSILALIKNGVDIFRLNSSHGNHDVFRQWITWIHQAEKTAKSHVAILLDLQGPKIRVGKFKNGSINLQVGEKVTLTTDKVIGSDKLIPVQYQAFSKSVSKKDLIHLNDGNLCLEVMSVNKNRVQAQVLQGGPLSDFKGVNLPDSNLDVDPITAKDKKDLYFGIEEGVDFIALSFVSAANDLRRLRKIIQKRGGHAEIIAKIERKAAIKNYKEIIEASDAVMVARGDLGVEIPLTEVPVIQRDIIRQCASLHKPVIVATQMLESMIENSRPTRAEVSDISTAVMECTDAVMLSAETASGSYPLEAVNMMRQSAKAMEYYQTTHHRILPWREFFHKNPTINLGITYSANRMVELLEAKALIIFTMSGKTAKMISSPRPMVPILVFTSSEHTARKLNIIRGVTPFLVKKKTDFLGDLSRIFNQLKKSNWVLPGDKVVIATSIPQEAPHWTNLLRVEIVP